MNEREKFYTLHSSNCIWLSLCMSKVALVQFRCWKSASEDAQSVLYGTCLCAALNLQKGHWTEFCTEYKNTLVFIRKVLLSYGTSVQVEYLLKLSLFASHSLCPDVYRVRRMWYLYFCVAPTDQTSADWQHCEVTQEPHYGLQGN